MRAATGSSAEGAGESRLGGKLEIMAATDFPEVTCSFSAGASAPLVRDAENAVASGEASDSVRIATVRVRTASRVCEVGGWWMVRSEGQGPACQWVSLLLTLASEAE